MAEYQPQLKRALEAINILEIANPDSDEFCNALAELGYQLKAGHLMG